MMGSPEGEWGRYRYAETQHEVTLTNDFIIQATEVTQAEFSDRMGYNNSLFDNCSDCPVERVTWGEAAAYCNALSASEELPLCYECDLSVRPAECTYYSSYLNRYDCPGYRLPTEAEWEYGARGGTTTETYAGDLVDLHNAYEVLDSIAWYHNNSSRRTHSVKGRTPNAYGLYDMLGNVWEWCEDGFVSDFETGSVTDPVFTEHFENDRPLSSGQSVRGGSWNSGPSNVRAAERSIGFNEPYSTDAPVGFRPVRTVP